MALSRHFFLPLLSGSALLCSLWVAHVPARADTTPETTAAPQAALATADPLQTSYAEDPTAEVKSDGVLDGHEAEAATSKPAASAVPAATPKAEADASEPLNPGLTEAETEPLAVETTGEQPAISQENLPMVEPAVEVPRQPLRTFDQPFSGPSTNFVNSGGLSTSQSYLTDYVLGPGDQIRLLVLGYDEFEGARVILPDGTINMPLIGSVPAAGRTLDTLAQDVENRLKVYLTDPVVDANLTVLRPVVVNIAGEVYRPGPVQLSSLTEARTTVDDNANITASTNTPTLSSALAAAGGIKRTADIRNVVVQRRLPNGGVREFSINLWDALQTGDGRELSIIVLADGDSIYVPTAQAGESLDPRLIASSSFAPTNVRVRVVGEVERPGEVTVQPNSSISSAIAAAGGPTQESASLNNVRLVRLTETGQIEEETVDVSSLVDNYQIQDGDVVVVPKRGILNPLDGLARIVAPILGPLNIFQILDDIFRDD